MSDDIINLISPEADAAVDQIIEDSGRLNRIVNGDGTTLVITEDGSPIPSVRKALIDNLYFKTPPIPWRNGTQVREFNQLYSFVDANGKSTWWYAPGATSSSPVTMADQPTNDVRWRVFLDSGNMDGIYAPILSPLFTGNPRVPTPAADDDSQSIANTSWVKTAIAKAIEIALPDWDDGIFNNLTVYNNTVLKNLQASGQVTFTGPKIDAVDAELNLKSMNLVGKDSVINFLWSEGSGYRTNLTPSKIFTTEMTANKLIGTTAEVGSERSTNPGLRAHGVTSLDTLVIRKNDRQDPTEDTLTVGGTTRLQNLIVEGDTTGINANVDGMNISPNSINNTTSVTTETLVVNDEAQFSGPVRFSKDVEFLGNVKGIGEALVGEDLTLKTLLVEETAQVVGGLNVTGPTRLGDVVFTGTTAGLVFPSPNIDGQDIKPNSIDTKGLIVDGPTVLKDLTITGVVRGLGEFSIDGEDVKPNSIVTNDLTVNGSLTMNGQIAINNIDAETVKTQSLEVTGLASFKNMTVAEDGILTGFERGVESKDILPKTIKTEEGAAVGTNLTVGGTLNVTGKTTLGDLDIKGTVTGISPDFGDEGDIQGRSLSVTGGISGNTVTASASVTTQDLHLSGRILDAEGNDFALKVDADTVGEAIKTLAIQPQSVTTKISDTDKGSVTTGRLTADSANLTGVTTNNINLVDGTVTGSLKVMGEILDKDGNPVAIMDIPSMIAGKDIAPKAITASGNISTSGTLQSGAATVNGGLTVGSVTASGEITSKENIVSEKDIHATGKIAALTAEIGGQATVGSLVVAGTITDSNGNPIGAPESLTGKDISPRTITATGGISTALGLTVGEALTTKSANVTTDLTVGGKLNVTGAVEVTSLKTGGLEVTQSAIIEGSVTAKGGLSTSSEGNLTVGGGGSVGKSLTVGDNLTVGHVDAEFEGDRLKVVGNQRVEGNLYVTGVINGNVDISGQDINPRSVTTTGDITVAGTASADIADFNSAEIGVSGSAVGLRVLNSASVAGDLTVVGKINATINQSEQDVVTKSLQTGNITAQAITTGTLTVSGNSVDAATAAVNAKSVTAQSFMVKPQVRTVDTGGFVPDGTTNVYDITVTRDTRIEAPSGLLAGNVAGSIVMYINQDATGGREVTFATEYKALNDEAVNIAPNGVTVVQLMYSGHGSVIDTLVLPRA